MRKLIAVLPLVAISACSGGGPETAGSVAAPAGATAVAVVAGNGSGVTTGGSATATPTTPGTGSGGTTASGGTGTGVTAGTSTVGATSDTHFLTITTEKTFDLVGGSQSLLVSTAGGTLYAANASTVRAPSGTVAYNPRDGIFTVKIADTKANVTADLRFQDPGHRTDFNPLLTPQWGVPELQGFNYLESIGTSVNDASTFFYQRPGTSTVYVSLAGYVRNNVPPGGTTNTFERGAFVFGDQTARGQIPASGGGTYRGGFIASMIANPTYDTTQKASAFQWIQGNSALSVDFGKSTVSLSLAGTVNQANMSGFQLPDTQLSIPTGAAFNASGSATIDLVKTGGFTGAFQSASFTDASGNVTNIDFAGITPGSSTAGASSIDGAFYGPGAVNVGGNLRIVGGVPDQRVDILGAFTGAKQPN